MFCRMAQQQGPLYLVFEAPCGPDVGPLIKRVIAVEDEVIEVRNGVVFVDGRALAEHHVSGDSNTSDFGPTAVPDGHVWVMGDNRKTSRDSRQFKAVPEEAIVGRAFMTVWPLFNLGSL
jgi:signal peptidase I